MNGIDRIKAAINFEKTDELAIIPQIFGHVAMISGIDISNYLIDGELMAKCQIDSLKKYQHDAVFSLFDVNVETEAAGSKLKFKKGHYPIIEQYAFGKDSEIDLSNIPDPSVCGRMPEMIKAASILRNEVGEHTIVVGCVLGPLTLVNQLLGAETALFMAIDDSERYQKYLDFATETVTRFGIAQLEAGVHLPLVFDPASSNEVIPESIFREFELPCLKKIFTAFKNSGSVANWLHITGKIEKILPYYEKANVNIANIDYCIDPNDAILKLPGICINGNIKPLDFVMAESNTIERQVWSLKKTFINRGGFILSSGCEIPLDAKPENVMVMVQAGRIKTSGMVLKINQKNKTRNIRFQPGSSLKDIIDNSDSEIRIRTGCKNNGACGLCQIKVISGMVSKATTSEMIHLGSEKISEGIRLACQLMPRGDMEIEVLAFEMLFTWKTPFENRIKEVIVDQTNNILDKNVKLGVAVDIGTTHLRISLVNMFDGNILDERFSTNPQLVFGSDIMTRLQIASEDQSDAMEMSRLVVDSIGKGILEMCTDHNLDTSSVEEVILVGNTVMLSLFSLKNFDKLMEPASWGKKLDCIPNDTHKWVKSLGISDSGVVKLLPPIAGFVGSDIVAGIHESINFRKNQCSLLIDFGTNSEVVLWNGTKLWVTSAAGGPAFEGSGISCGVPAEPGAISRIKEINDKLEFDIIPNSEIKGICGSGMVDLFAYLLSQKIINEMGQITNDKMEVIFYEENGVELSLLKQDIDLFQRAKAAIGSAIQVLVKKSGVKIQDIEEVSVAGAFGKYLDIKNAITIGLLPDLPEDRFVLKGNTALRGVEKLLLNKKSQDYLDEINNRVKYINLSQSENFETLFFDNLFLKKMN